MAEAMGVHTRKEGRRAHTEMYDGRSSSGASSSVPPGAGAQGIPDDLEEAHPGAGSESDEQAPNDDPALRAGLHALVSVRHLFRSLREVERAGLPDDPYALFLSGLRRLNAPPKHFDVPSLMYATATTARTTRKLDRGFLSPCARYATVGAGEGVERLFAREAKGPYRYRWFPAHFTGAIDLEVRCELCKKNGSKLVHFTHLQLRDRPSRDDHATGWGVNDQGAERLSVSDFLSKFNGRVFRVDRTRDLADIAECVNDDHKVLEQRLRFRRLPDVLVVDVEPCGKRSYTELSESYAGNMDQVTSDDVETDEDAREDGSMFRAILYRDERPTASVSGTAVGVERVRDLWHTTLTPGEIASLTFEQLQGQEGYADAHEKARRLQEIEATARYTLRTAVARGPGDEYLTYEMGLITDERGEVQMRADAANGVKQDVRVFAYRFKRPTTEVPGGVEAAPVVLPVNFRLTTLLYDCDREEQRRKLEERYEQREQGRRREGGRHPTPGDEQVSEDRRGAPPVNIALSALETCACRRCELVKSLWDWYEREMDCVDAPDDGGDTENILLHLDDDASMPSAGKGKSPWLKWGIVFRDARGVGIHPGYILVKYLSSDNQQRALGGKHRRFDENEARGVIDLGPKTTVNERILNDPPLSLTGEMTYPERIKWLAEEGPPETERRATTRQLFLMEKVAWYAAEYLRRFLVRASVVQKAEIRYRLLEDMIYTKLKALGRSNLEDARSVGNESGDYRVTLDARREDLAKDYPREPDELIEKREREIVRLANLRANLVELLKSKRKQSTANTVTKEYTQRIRGTISEIASILEGDSGVDPGMNERIDHLRMTRYWDQLRDHVVRRLRSATEFRETWIRESYVIRLYQLYHIESGALRLDGDTEGAALEIQRRGVELDNELQGFSEDARFLGRLFGGRYLPDFPPKGLELLYLQAAGATEDAMAVRPILLPNADVDLRKFVEDFAVQHNIRRKRLAERNSAARPQPRGMNIPSKGWGKAGGSTGESERVRPSKTLQRPAATLPEPLTLDITANAEEVRLCGNPPLKSVLSGDGPNTAAVALQLLTGSHTLRLLFEDAWLCTYGFGALQEMGEEYVGVIARIFHRAVLGHSAFLPNLVVPDGGAGATDVLDHFLKSDYEWAKTKKVDEKKKPKTGKRAQPILAVHSTRADTHATDGGYVLVVVSLKLGAGDVTKALQQRADEKAGDRPAAPVLLVNVEEAELMEFKVERKLVISRASGTDTYALRGLLISSPDTAYQAVLSVRGSWYTYDGSKYPAATSEPKAVSVPALLLFDLIPGPIVIDDGRGKAGKRKRASGDPILEES